VNGKLVAGFLAATALLAGGAMYYLQVYAFYRPAVLPAGAEIALMPNVGDAPQPIPVRDVQAIDADSSPLRFRACFKTDLTLEAAEAAYLPYLRAAPLVAPHWFDCFDAAAIGAALEAGEAKAFLGQRGVQTHVDRVIALFPDGRGFAWHQWNEDPPIPGG
jgi:hypothetical protein